MIRKYVSLACTALALGLCGQPLATQAQVTLKSISLGASYWNPSLDYWNNRSFLTDYNSGQGANLSGAIMPTAALEIGLAKGFSIGGRVGYWKQTASSGLSIGGVKRTETFALSIIPVALDLKYTFGEPASADAKMPFITPYVGVSVARYLINNKLDRQVVDNTGSLNETQTGNSYGVQVFVGAEKKLVRKLYLGLDLRYHLGKYKQVVTTESASTGEPVSLNGLEAGLSLRVKFQ